MKRLAFIAAAGSALLLGGAFGFQILGYPPCAMCLWQRWPHAAAIALGVLIYLLGYRILAWFGALAAATTAGIGFFHAGVEKDWWEGPTTCTSGSIDGLSPEQLLEQILAAPLVRCDDVAWALGGISMAGWNGLLSTGLMLIWIKAATQK
ncbi:MAG: disulfide bond formation protein B [Litoreibacter sp.]